MQFARAEGIVPAPEANHAVKGAIDEALRCREEGVSRAILFNLCGHGHFDMQAYMDYFAGKLDDQDYDESELAMALAGLPSVGRLRSGSEAATQQTVAAVSGRFLSTPLFHRNATPAAPVRCMLCEEVNHDFTAPIAVGTLVVAAITAWPQPTGAQRPQHDQPALDTRVKAFLAEHAGTWRDLNVPASDGQLLHDLIVKHRYTRALEIGTSTGHSGIWIAWALSKTGGKLITVELDEGRHREALKNFEAAGLSAFIDARLGDAHAIVPALAGPFDFVFSDADKDWYPKYFEAVFPKLTSEGCYTHAQCERVRPAWRGRIPRVPGSASRDARRHHCGRRKRRRPGNHLQASPVTWLARVTSDERCGGAGGADGQGAVGISQFETSALPPGMRAHGGSAPADTAPPAPSHFSGSTHILRVPATPAMATAPWSPCRSP